MAASYPSATKSFTTKTDSPTSTIFAAHVNDLQDEVVAVENGLRTGLAHNILPDTDNTRDLGSASKQFNDIFLGGTISVSGGLQLFDIGVCEGRLTALTATAVPTSDVTAATSIYFTPYKGNRIALYDGTRWHIVAFTELSIALGADAANTNYDVFGVLSAGALTIERLAWSSDTGRATNLTFQNGVYVKTGDTTRRYLGTYRTTGTVGQTENSRAKRFVWNYYHRVRQDMVVMETTDNWTYTTAALRQANNATANQLAVVVGVPEEAIDVQVLAVAANSTGGVNFAVSIGEDLTNAHATGVLTHVAAPAANVFGPVSATLRKLVPAGFHFYTWLEFSVATGTTTWQGDGGVTYLKSGITGSING
jgi:hypothetical protein